MRSAARSTAPSPASRPRKPRCAWTRTTCRRRRRPRKGTYRPGFLAAIDACLKVRHSERPRSVAQLRPMLVSATGTAETPDWALGQGVHGADQGADQSAGDPPDTHAAQPAATRWLAMAAALVALVGGAYGGLEYARWQPAGKGTVVAEAARQSAAEADSRANAATDADRRRAELDAERLRTEAEASRRQAEAEAERRRDEETQRAAAQQEAARKAEAQRRRSRRRTSACGSQRPRSMRTSVRHSSSACRRCSARAVATTGPSMDAARGAGRPRPVRCGRWPEGQVQAGAYRSSQGDGQRLRGLAERCWRDQRRYVRRQAQASQTRGRENATTARGEERPAVAATGCSQAPGPAIGRRRPSGARRHVRRLDVLQFLVHG